MKTTLIPASGLAAACLVAALAGAAVAQPVAAQPALAQPDVAAGAPLPMPETQHGIAYLNGGVGEDAQAAVKSARASYNLYLTFANRTGEYRADVQVDIWDSKGVQRFSLSKAGPLLYVKLPPGTYRVMASSAGQRYERTARIGATGGQELAFTWAPEPEPDTSAR